MDIKIFYSKMGFVQSDVFALVIYANENKSSRSQEETFQVSRLPVYPITTIDISMHLGWRFFLVLFFFFIRRIVKWKGQSILSDKNDSKYNKVWEILFEKYYYNWWKL